MRILLTTDVIGGVWRYTVTLVHKLTERGHECAVAVIGSPTPELLAELPESVATFHNALRLESMDPELEDIPIGTRWLEAVAAEWRPDVIHMNQLTYATGTFPAPVLVVAHSDVLSWYVEVKNREAPAEWGAYAAAVREGMAAADLVVAPTAYQSGRLARHYGRTAVKVIHNGIEPPPAKDRPPASERSLLLVAGRAWDDAKGIALLDRALRELGSDAPSVHLVGPLLGPGGEELEADELVTHGEVTGSTMGRFYDNTRLYIGPSLYEPFGLSPLEAAGRGCCLLLSGIGSFRELWTDAAAFFEPLHPDVLANRIRAVLRDPTRLDELADRARDRALERYTADRMTDLYERVYLELQPARTR